jgi:uncharacterized protein YqhQ
MLDEFNQFFALLRRYGTLKLEYAKLTAAEKFTLLVGWMAIGLICLICASFLIFLLSLAVAELFKTIMCPALAYVCVSGIFLLLIIVVLLLRKSLVINPISRFITMVLFEKGKRD